MIQAQLMMNEKDKKKTSESTERFDHCQNDSKGLLYK